MHFSHASLFEPKLLDELLAGGGPPLPHFRAALKEGRARLRERHFAGARAADIVAGHAWLVDQLLARAWQLHLPDRPQDVTLALVAVGGYGRGELHPCSDIDLMLLMEKDRHERIRPFVETWLNFLWDMGLEVGHSVRSLRDCVREAHKDITVATNLMESRLLAGDAALLAAMQARTGPEKMWPGRKFFSAKFAEQNERHHRFDDTAYNLEPNIKEGPGGLRDIQMIHWVTQRHFGTRSLHDLVAHEFLTEDEYRSLVRGRDLLWQLRNGLHYLAGRREDRLLFDHQRALAGQMGYADRPDGLAVEQLMQRYYRTVKELALLNEILLQHFQEAILSPPRSRPRPLNRRFQSRNGFIEATHANTFAHAPFALLEMFLLLQQHPHLKGVRASTIRLLRANLHRIDEKFRADLACRSLFMEILRQKRGITHELRRMNAYGVLGAYVPAFGRIVGQMQHDLFHVYTVDEHSLFVVRNLRRFTVPEFRHEFPFASELIGRVFKPERLYLAGLFHDIAKGRGGDHSRLGEQEAERFCRLHNLSEYDTRFVSWLVRNHLLMSWTAQRQDISDPDVILSFARQVGDEERLDNLYLLTVADMRGTSPAVWNGWKDRLLSQLYRATKQVLQRGFGEPIDTEAHIADLRAEAAMRLAKTGVAQARVDEFWALMDADYFLRHDADSLAWHAQVIAQGDAAGDRPIVAARYIPGNGGSELLVFTPDRPDLFAIVTGGFDRLHLSIVDARIYTSRTGFALDTFVFLDHTAQPVADGRALAHIQQAMRAQLVRPMPGRSFAGINMPRAVKHFPIETRVSFSASRNGQHTVMEVIAQDRPGLLYQIALALQECGVNLVTAKVATYGARAEDIFFINERDGGPVNAPERVQCLRTGIQRRLQPAPDSKQPAAQQISF